MTQREGDSHLLYVDPDPAYRRTVASVFEPEWAVTTAESAAEGIDAVDGSFECIVVASQLPETSGLDFFHELDAEELPVVLFAANEDVDLLRRAFRAGVTDVIYKQRSSGGGVDAESSGESSTLSDEPVTLGVEPAVSSDEPAVSSDITDGIVGLRNSLESLEDESADLNGVTLDVSRSLMGAAADEVDMKTEWALQSLAEKIDANQCLIYEVGDQATLELAHGWSDDETVATEPHRGLFGIGRDELSAEAFPGFGSQLQQFEAACVDVTTVADEPGDSHDTLTAAGNAESGVTTIDPVEITEAVTATTETGTLLALPIVIEWQLFGIIVITVDQPREWTEEARQRLQAIGELVGHMERRRRQRHALERQNEQLEQFASVISHDLQNPLNVITGYLDLASETGDLDHLEPAVNAAGRMESLLRDLLTLAREGRAVGETEPVELESLITAAWNSVETRDATLELSGFDDADSVMVDESRLTEAFENLFKNAVVHASEDVSMRVELTDDTVIIADDGPGIPVDKRDEVFEYGHTGGNGTGLGLAIVRSIIEGHGWEINATESEDGGARFEIDFCR